jgi:hypothetical protein
MNITAMIVGADTEWVCPTCGMQPARLPHHYLAALCQHLLAVVTLQFSQGLSAALSDTLAPCIPEWALVQTLLGQYVACSSRVRLPLQVVSVTLPCNGTTKSGMTWDAQYCDDYSYAEAANAAITAKGLANLADYP